MSVDICAISHSEVIQTMLKFLKLNGTWTVVEGLNPRDCSFPVSNTNFDYKRFHMGFSKFWYQYFMTFFAWNAVYMLVHVQIFLPGIAAIFSEVVPMITNTDLSDLSQNGKDHQSWHEE